MANTPRARIRIKITELQLIGAVQVHKDLRNGKRRCNPARARGGLEGAEPSGKLLAGIFGGHRGLGIRLVFPDAELVKLAFPMWCLQAGVIFPLSALVSSFLVYMLYEKSFGHTKAGKLKWLAYTFLAYFLITVLAVPVFATVGSSISERTALENFLHAYAGMLMQAPWEFGVYATLFFSSNIFSTFGMVRNSFPVGLSVRPIVLPIIAMAIMAGIALNVNLKTKHDIQEEFMNETHRVGDFLPETDDVSIGNAIKAHEKKYGLQVTGVVSDELLQKLRQEPTKLEFTVGDKDADYDKLGRCAPI